MYYVSNMLRPILKAGLFSHLAFRCVNLKALKYKAVFKGLCHTCIMADSNQFLNIIILLEIKVKCDL